MEQRDLSDFTLPCLEHYRRLGLEFECVYSGFLSSQEQIDHCLKFFSTYQDALAVVDPVMGDHGRPYRTITPQMRSRLGELVRVADIITPNPVSYTHLDVYKRQPYIRSYQCGPCCFRHRTGSLPGFLPAGFYPHR